MGQGQEVHARRLVQHSMASVSAIAINVNRTQYGKRKCYSNQSYVLHVPNML